MSRLRFVGVALFSFTAACFGEAPGGSSGLEGESGSSGSPEATTGESESSTVADTSSTSVDASTTDPSTSESGESSGDPDTGTGSTGEPPDECLCPDGSLVCESFEKGFDPEEEPWGFPGGGGSVEPEVVGDPVHCGDAALSAAVEAGDSYSSLSHLLPPEMLSPGVHRIEAWVQLQGKCNAALTRILQVQLNSGPPVSTFAYGIDLFVEPGYVELRVQAAAGVYEPNPMAAAFDENAWHDVAIEFDLSVQPPLVSVLIDGVYVLENVQGPPSTVMPADPRLTASVGVFRFPSFEQDCTAVYDDFSAG